MVRKGPRKVSVMERTWLSKPNTNFVARRNDVLSFVCFDAIMPGNYAIAGSKDNKRSGRLRS